MSLDVNDITGTVEAPEPRYTAKQLGRWSETRVAGIEARVAYWAQPWWKRWRATRPPEWGQE